MSTAIVTLTRLVILLSFAIVPVNVADAQGFAACPRTEMLVPTDLPDRNLRSTLQYGEQVAIDGARALVATHSDNTGGLLGNQGSVYVFESQPDGTWLEVAKLVDVEGNVNSMLGRSIDLAGDFALVGAPRDRRRGTNSGTVLIFERQPDGSWPPVRLIPSEENVTAMFGTAVAIQGQRAVVGAPMFPNVGAAGGDLFVFERDAMGNWIETAILGAADVRREFGKTVALDGDRLLVGADDDDNGLLAGAAILFELDEQGSWTRVTKLKADDGVAFDFFGARVELDGDRVAVTGGLARTEGEAGETAVYIFERDASGSWLQSAKLIPPDDTFPNFGNSVLPYGNSLDLDGDRLVIGAARSTDVFTLQAPTALVYERRSADTWELVAQFDFSSDGRFPDAAFAKTSGDCLLSGGNGEARVLPLPEPSARLAHALAVIAIGAIAWARQQRRSSIRGPESRRRLE